MQWRHYFIEIKEDQLIDNNMVLLFCLLVFVSCLFFRNLPLSNKRCIASSVYLDHKCLFDEVRIQNIWKSKTYLKCEELIKTFVNLIAVRKISCSKLCKCTILEYNTSPTMLVSLVTIIVMKTYKKKRIMQKIIDKLIVIRK